MADDDRSHGREVPAGTPTEREGVTVDAPSMGGALFPGAELGGRYRVVCRVGAGGMGEVWRAFDLKLRVEVALKALRGELFEDERRRDLLRREVRAAREVVSPNVCRIFDLVEADGRELVSMEYVDGATLLSVLQERGPLELKEAQDIASQFLAGLEAIHAAGLVHRDVKPENIMVTRAGRVVVMDFGLARREEDPARSASGTPAYMAPEQARGEAVDARADVYAAGVVLAEMVCPEGITSIQSRQSLWEGVRSEPPKLPDTPWAPVLKKAVAREPERRYRTAHTLTRALEDVTLRVAGAEDLHPYPGLASFTEADAEYFFGREAEVEQMWRRLEGPARLLGLAGPSGAGKSSFLRAGLIPGAGPGWAVVRCTPGDGAISSLRRALIPELAGDTEALQQLVDADDDDSLCAAVARWRGRHDRGLLIVDQFEELFTLNRGDEQARFASVLGSLALRADVHVLLAMRDDFLAPCNGHEALRPIFSELTLLDPPAGVALRRALTQPALQCGYRFEDDALVEEMLGEVEGERGALPLLAFAAARLWEKRDREAGLLTRQAYQDIGGVGGALAQHAEATMDRIGSERIGIVRELFRNLVTAEGTRAVREWRELLSVFDGGSQSLTSRARRPEAPPQPLSSRASAGPKGQSESRDPHRLQTELPTTGSLQASGDPSTSRPSEGRSAQDDRKRSAEGVLRALIDARLLTSYELRQEEGEPTRRVEIIHESLLANWPRLVRWQTQDADAVQLRDQLRQAARTWHEHGRSDDLLWAGSAFREYAVWRERYSGGLTELEEAFAAAMASFATRRRRRRRLAVAASLALLLAVLAGVGRAAVERRRAEAEAAQREAAQILAVGRLRLAHQPNAALAFAIASLERADNQPARRFAVEVLAQGPPALFLNEPVGPWGLAWSPDGRWISLGHDIGFGLVDSGASQARRLSSTFTQGGGGFTSDSQHLVRGTVHDGVGVLEVWSIPEGRLEHTLDYPPGKFWIVGDRLLTMTFDTPGPRGERAIPVRLLALDGTTERELGVWRPQGRVGTEVDPTGTWLVSLQGGRVLQHRIDSLDAPPRVLGTCPEDAALRSTPPGDLALRVGPWRDRAVYSDASGEVRIWDLPTSTLLRTLKSPADAQGAALDPTGRYAATGPWDQGLPPRSMFLFDLAAPAMAEPLPLLASDMSYLNYMVFSPDGNWLASVHGTIALLWDMSGYRSVVVGRAELPVVAFADDGHLLSGAFDGVLRRWPLDPESAEGVAELWSRPGVKITYLEVNPTSRAVVVFDFESWGGFVVPLDGSKATTTGVERLPPEPGLRTSCVLLDPSGRFVAMNVFQFGLPELESIRVVDLATGETRTLDAPFGEEEGCMTGTEDEGNNLTYWLPDGRLLSDGDGGLRVWDLASGTSRLLLPCRKDRICLWPTPDSSAVLCFDSAGGSAVTVFDLGSGTTREIASHGNRVSAIAVDPSGAVLVTGDKDGIVRVGPLSGEEPHLLFGHAGGVKSVAVSPDGRRIASSGDDGTIRLWEMPDLTKPPLHNLPHDELLAKLKSLTNLRAVPDPAAATGWKTEIGPFPGWAEVPTW
jgi:WD40 repeat protein